MASRRPSAAPGSAGLPPEPATALRIELGDALEDLQRALREEPPVSIRLNSAKLPALAHPTLAPRRPVPWCETGRYLGTRPVFTLDPLLHAGAYYVQEASSMFLEQALLAGGSRDRPILALDLCAAPGGKATHLLSLLHPGSLVVCNEPVPSRQPALKENIWKWGVGNSVITAGRPEEFAELRETFDLILVDAPCSGEGLFRRDPFARVQWSAALVRQCALRQRSILDHAWTALKPGGCLIYSTCTWERSENEEQVERLVKEHGAAMQDVPVDERWGIVRGDHGVRFYPHRVEGEGFFLSMLRKQGDRLDRRDAEEGDFREIDEGGIMHLFPRQWSGTIDALRANVRVIAPGLPAYDRRSGVIKPHPALALHASARTRHPADTLELRDDQAAGYLRGEAIRSPGARGDRLVTHGGVPLGWVRGAGDRWNSAWPKAWRIRMR